MTLAEANILVVDDEPVLLLTFAIVLRQKGATVHSTANGAEAIALLEQVRIDVILTDRQMPVMDGLTLLRTLHARGSKIPSILFVSGMETESAAEMAKLGVIETVTKPLHPDTLTRVLTKALAPLPSPPGSSVAA